ncbi:expressed unknown protein [Seminavis robusta]|uniref:Uncharacterized protein n=1 Tax=Seminavis robusta TaxID=568900 RepID=A0A9N8DSL8_9STRA|nr:expressed unknown protein [Seminavis robusta]|eukprot:Sro313_g114710.1 n/a (138) ;mRNA; f:5902-6428
MLEQRKDEMEMSAPEPSSAMFGGVAGVSIVGGAFIVAAEAGFFRNEEIAIDRQSREMVDNMLATMPRECDVQFIPDFQLVCGQRIVGNHDTTTTSSQRLDLPFCRTLLVMPFGWKPGSESRRMLESASRRMKGGPER